MKRVCVFCGASMGNRPLYAETAREAGRVLGERGLGLVYGGTSIGMMGQVADAALRAGGSAVGILPRSLEDKEIAHPTLSELRVVDSLAERKQLMFDLSDAFLVLPGGTGTLDELSEMMTWAQLGYHAKPIGVLNLEGYFDGLLAFLRHAVGEGLLRQRHLELLTVDTALAPLVEALASGMDPVPARAG